MPFKILFSKNEMNINFKLFNLAFLKSTQDNHMKPVYPLQKIQKKFKITFIFSIFSR